MANGWQSHPDRSPLSWATIGELRVAGITMMELKWRFQTHRVKLANLGMEPPQRPEPRQR